MPTGVSRHDEQDRPLRAAARAGLVLNGLLHLVVAALALQVALGGVARADQGGALQAVAAEPFGRPLLWLAVTGFAGVALWRVREAWHGHRAVRDRRERSQKRLFAAGQAVVYGGLTALALRVAVGSSAGSGGQGVTAWVLARPGGRWVVAAAGAAITVTGLVMAWRGWRLAFLEDVDAYRAERRVRRAAERAGQFGSVAKGLAVAVIGVLVTTAGLRSQPARAEGLDAALKALAGQAYGPPALVAVAVGLALYGLFAFFDARYHRV